MRGRRPNGRRWRPRRRSTPRSGEPKRRGERRAGSRMRSRPRGRTRGRRRRDHPARSADGPISPRNRSSASLRARRPTAAAAARRRRDGGGPGARGRAAPGDAGGGPGARGRAAPGDAGGVTSRARARSPARRGRATRRGGRRPRPGGRAARRGGRGAGAGSRAPGPPAARPGPPPRPARSPAAPGSREPAARPGQAGRRPQPRADLRPRPSRPRDSHRDLHPLGSRRHRVSEAGRAASGRRGAGTMARPMRRRSALPIARPAARARPPDRARRPRRLGVRRGAQGLPVGRKDRRLRRTPTRRCATPPTRCRRTSSSTRPTSPPRSARRSTSAPRAPAAARAADRTARRRRRRRPPATTTPPGGARRPRRHAPSGHHLAAARHRAAGSDPQRAPPPRLGTLAFPLWVVIAGGALLLLGALAVVFARWMGWDGRHLAGARQACGEAAFRAGRHVGRLSRLDPPGAIGPATLRGADRRNRPSRCRGNPCCERSSGTRCRADPRTLFVGADPARTSAVPSDREAMILCYPHSTEQDITEAAKCGETEEKRYGSGPGDHDDDAAKDWRGPHRPAPFHDAGHPPVRHGRVGAARCPHRRTATRSPSSSATSSFP